MAQKRPRSKTADPDPNVAAPPLWRLPESTAPQSPRGQRARWLLAAAIILQVAWIVALAAMAIFAKWRT